jgi:Icc-related predicted phosphoesterase
MNWVDNLARLFRLSNEDKEAANNVASDVMRQTYTPKALPIDFDLKALVIADTHGCLRDDEVPMDHNADVCLLLGDFSVRDLQIIKDRVTNIPIYGVLGNHDGFDLYEHCGIENIHGKVVEVKGVRVAGIQGSLRYKYSDMPLYTDDESVEIAESMDAADILISHDSPKYLHGTNDFAHSGLHGITRYCEKWSIPLNIHGHHHDPKEFVLDNGTRSICCYQVQVVQITPNRCVTT